MYQRKNFELIFSFLVVDSFYAGIKWEFWLRKWMLKFMAFVNDSWGWAREKEAESYHSSQQNSGQYLTWFFWFLMSRNTGLKWRGISNIRLCFLDPEGCSLSKEMLRWRCSQMGSPQIIFWETWLPLISRTMMMKEKKKELTLTEIFNLLVLFDFNNYLMEGKYMYPY